MTHRRVDPLRGLALVIVACALMPLSVAGQSQTVGSPKTDAMPTWTPPLTPEGQPDLQGVWLNNSATPFERPTALEGKLLLTDDEVAELQRRADRLFEDGSADIALGDSLFLAALSNPERYKNPNGSGRNAVWMVPREFNNRTSLIVDPPNGKIPTQTPQARERRALEAERERAPTGPEALSNAVRCITPGVPRIGPAASGDPLYGYYQILQSPGFVVLVMETFHDARIVPLDGRPHLHENIPQWNGDSRGRWDGNTLIVDTTNFSPKSNFLGSAEHLHLVERFTRVAPDVINYEVTLTDPTTWSAPWTAVIRLKQMQTSIYEYACHEGNHSMIGILAGARTEEKAREDAARDPK
jgi:hypothetical protein